MNEVFIACEADDRLQEAVGRLMPQLSPSLGIPSPEELRRIVASPATRLFCIGGGGRIEGMLSLAWYDVPSGRHAWIEDVVVDGLCRGCGYGEQLVRAALEYAAQIGADKVSLTSNAARAAAHALYRKMGFEPYDTALFRLKLK